MGELKNKTVLITGAAARLGAQTARQLHSEGAFIIIHYRSSDKNALALKEELLALRAKSAEMIQMDLLETEQLPAFIEKVIHINGQLDVLVNNASTYYPTPVESSTIDQWDDLFGSNAKAPYFLAKAAASELQKNQGCIVNMVDIHAQRPNKDYPIYSMAKAANAMMVQSLAQELAPDIRVNGVAPGAVLWPAGAEGDKAKQRALQRIPLGRPGVPDDIAKTVSFLVKSDYITGQIIAVDGGRTVQQ